MDMGEELEQSLLGWTAEFPSDSIRHIYSLLNNGSGTQLRGVALLSDRRPKNKSFRKIFDVVFTPKISVIGNSYYLYGDFLEQVIEKRYSNGKVSARILQMDIGKNDFGLIYPRYGALLKPEHFVIPFFADYLRVRPPQ